MWPTLKRREQFSLVYSQGRKGTCRTLVLFHLENAPDDQMVAFVASRKVGGAVERNRAKRLLRAAFSQLESKEELPRGWLVLVARRAILEYKSQNVAEHLAELLRSAEEDDALKTPPRA